MANYKNTGINNSGYWNSGDGNSGDRNSGYWNSGDRNSGDRNSGYCNSGDRNSGYWNSGNCNSGYFNTNEPCVRMFNKDTGLKGDEVNIPRFLYHLKLTEWISESDMSDQEKIDNAHFHTEEGYLKTYEYKEAWANLWKEVTQEDIKALKALPNFDAKIFEEITGIDVAEDTKQEAKKKELLEKAQELIENAKELQKQAERL
ncbi:MAG: hypothetical protein VKL42_01690 [Snowella sp.]|nr:hypothetical protein [Snowella sp.]